MAGKPQKLRGSAVPAELELVRMELELNRFQLPTGLVVSGRDLLHEIAYVLRPRAHERRIAPYGVVIASGIFSQGEKIASAPPLEESLIRLAADGRRIFLVYHAGGGPELWQITRPCDTGLELLSLADHSRGLVLKRIESGLVTMANEGWIYTISGREWLLRRPVVEMWDAVAQVAPGRVELARPLLQLCSHVLSPKNLGATFVWYLTEPTRDEAAAWTNRPDIRLLKLSVDDNVGYAEIAHLARHHDGAFLVGSDGRILSLGGHLTYKQATAALLSPYRGTRHTSAKYYSYEHSEAIVFVVSEDGGVSVFSDGAKVADSPVQVVPPPEFEMLAKMKFGAFLPVEDQVDEEQDEALATASEIREATCDKCRKTLAIQILTAPRMIREKTVDCPVCGKLGVYAATCLSLKATPLKKF